METAQVFCVITLFLPFSLLFKINFALQKYSFLNLSFISCSFILSYSNIPRCLYTSSSISLVFSPLGNSVLSVDLTFPLFIIITPYFPQFLYFLSCILFVQLVAYHSHQENCRYFQQQFLSSTFTLKGGTILVCNYQQHFLYWGLFDKKLSYLMSYCLFMLLIPLTSLHFLHALSNYPICYSNIVYSLQHLVFHY